MLQDLSRYCNWLCLERHGPDGEPGDIVIAGLPKFIQGWNDVNFANGGFDIEISEGGVYIGYQQLMLILI